MNSTATDLSTSRIVSDLARLLRSRHWAQSLKLFSPQAARNMLLGNVRSRFRGRGMEFEEVRRYQAGDDIRTIDWKVSARANDTYTKLFCEERERPCHIIVDQRSSLFFGSKVQFKSVLAAELAAGIAWAALAGGDRVGGQVIGDYSDSDCRARRSKQAVLKFIHELDEFNSKLSETTSAIDDDHINTKSAKPSSMANTLSECHRITRPGTAVFIISDFYDFDLSAAKALVKLAKRTDLSLLQVVDPLEEQLPINANIAISNGIESGRVMLSNKLTQRYTEARQQHFTVLENAAIQSKAFYTKISTRQSVDLRLAKFSLNSLCISCP